MTVIVLILGFKFGETAICFTSCQILNFGIPHSIIMWNLNLKNYPQT